MKDSNTSPLKVTLSNGSWFYLGGVKSLYYREVAKEGIGMVMVQTFIALQDEEKNDIALLLHKDVESISIEQP